MALTQTQVSQLYVAIFNRASEGAGNTYWQSSADMATCANYMLATPDASTYFGTSLNTNQAFIEHIYLNTLNKSATDDPTGIAYWKNLLDGGMSRGAVVAALVTAVGDYASSTDPTTMNAYNQFTNRVTVSNYMANTVSAAPTDYATSTAFSSGLPVTYDSTTVTSAQLKVGDLATPTYTIAAGATSVTEGSSVTFTVTSSVAQSADRTMNYQIAGVAVAGGTATPASDLGQVTGTVTILAGATTGTLTLTPTDDGATEGFEGFNVSLFDSTFATVATSGNVVIKDGATAGQTFTLTTGMDTITGTSGNDTINSTLAATGSTLNAFDNINGGDGTDTLNIAATAANNLTLPASVTFSNLENVNVSQAASGGTGTGALTVTNTTFGTGVKSFNYTDASAAAEMTAAVVSVTLDSATDVSVKAVGAGTFTTVAVTDTSTTAGSYGNTLTNVTVNKASGAATLTGNKIATVNLNAVSGLTTVSAAAGTRGLTVNASGTTAQGGLTDATATSVTLNVTGNQTFGTLTAAKATAVTINATGTVTETLAAASATALTLDGTKLNTLTVTGTDPIATITVKGSGGVTSNVSGITSLATVDTTASTAAAPASGTATGANTLTIGTGVTYNGGAGQDVVTVGATTKAVSLGAGNDTAVVSVTALGAGGSIAGGDGTDVLKLANADAVTLSTAGTAQAAFKAAVTSFETLDITTQTASTVDVSQMGTFSQVNMVSASTAQVLAGITSGMTIQSTYGAAGTSITTNALTSAADTMTFVMKGDLSGGVRVFGTLANPGVETLTLNMADTNTTFASTLATLTVTDTSLKNLTISGNNGLGLTHSGTALYNIDASGLTKGAITFTSAALATDTTAKGSVSGGDTLDLSSAVAKTDITAYAGTNTLKGSSGAYANTITGGTGIDTISGGSAIDTIKAGAGTTGNTITGAGGADTIDLTGSTGSDVLRFDTIATSANLTGSQVDVVTGFKAGTDKINFAQGALSLTGVTTDGAGDAVAAMAAVVSNATSVATIADVYTALAAYTTLTASAAGGTATVAQVYNFTTGAAAGSYLVVNDATIGFQGATDVVVKLIGLDGTLSAADFTFTA